MSKPTNLLPWLLRCTDRDPETGEAVWPKVWHPDFGVLYPNDIHGAALFATVGEGGPEWGSNDLGKCKILLKPFSSLVAQVRENPSDNDAVRAFGPGYAATVVREIIYIRLTATDDLICRMWEGFKIKMEVGFSIDWHSSLLRAGYNVMGVPSELVINPEELE